MYRSDGGTEENNTELLKMIGSVSKLKYTHIVLTGDYNLPDIIIIIIRFISDKTSIYVYIKYN